jgi:hypothetical protein
MHHLGFSALRKPSRGEFRLLHSHEGSAAHPYPCHRVPARAGVALGRPRSGDRQGRWRVGRIFHLICSCCSASAAASDLALADNFELLAGCFALHGRLDAQSAIRVVWFLLAWFTGAFMTFKNPLRGPLYWKWTEYVPASASHLLLVICTD